MKTQFAIAAMLVAVGCSPAAPPAPAPTPIVSAAETVAPAAAQPAPISLAGKWTGSITCYKIESPLQMTIDAAKPGEAAMGKGPNGNLAWPATLSVNAPTRIVTVLSKGSADGAERIEGLLSDDGLTISGVMSKQLCTSFALKRAG
jgi:hypothetical protein